MMEEGGGRSAFVFAAGVVPVVDFLVVEDKEGTSSKILICSRSEMRRDGGFAGLEVGVALVFLVAVVVWVLANGSDDVGWPSFLKLKNEKGFSFPPFFDPLADGPPLGAVGPDFAVSKMGGPSSSSSSTTRNCFAICMGGEDTRD
jgi:hypothetical protein